MKTKAQSALKAVTFSFDDGVTQDIGLIELFNEFGLKATFNLNSARLGEKGKVMCRSITGKDVSVRHDKVKKEDVRSIYAGHEIAAHTLTHPFLPHLDDRDVVREVEEDRLRLSDIAGYEVTGFAYPGGGINFDERVSTLIRTRTGIAFARTTRETGTFEMPDPDGLYTLHPTARHRDINTLFSLADRFLAAKSEAPMMFYIWGHSYELDADCNRGEFREFLKYISGRDGVFYGTNSECLALCK